MLLGNENNQFSANKYYVYIVNFKGGLFMHINIIPGCTACGICESMCESVFKVDTVAHANDENANKNKDCAKAAAEACPVHVIKIEE